MKKISSREFSKDFAKHAQSLKPDERLVITKHGKPIGTFTKTVPPRRRRHRNFMKDLVNAPYPVEVGDELARRVLHETVL